MAPTVELPALGALDALTSIVKRRIEGSRVLKEKENSKLTCEGYRQMRTDLNKQQFILPLDSDNTKASIYYIKQKFIRFCNDLKLGDWRTALQPQNCDKGMTMSFLYWICETYLAKRRKKGKRKSVNQYWRDFKMLFRRANGERVDANDSNEVVKYINTKLRVLFELDTSVKPKPVTGPDDLLLLLVQHWARDESIFPTEDDRLDLPTIMLFQSYTGCRPAELVHAPRGRGLQDPLDDDTKFSPDMEEHAYDDESNYGDEDSGYTSATGNNSEDVVADATDSEDGNFIDDSDDDDDDFNRCHFDGADNTATEDTTNCCTSKVTDLGALVRSSALEQQTQDPDVFKEPVREFKALCYEDICLWIVKNPKRGDRDLLAMEINLRHHKGVDNKPKPTTFLFREHPLAILCPISHILARALRDDAILVDGYTTAEPFFDTNLQDPIQAVKVHWKPSMLKVPVFRRSVQMGTGYQKSMTEPMPYSTYAFYLERLGEDTGLEEKLTSYCFRRGLANAINGVADTAVRDQVMRHDPMTGVFSGAYLNHRVKFNTQDAFLERDVSDDGLTRAFAHMSLRCNPGIPKAVPAVVLRALPPDPDITDLERQKATMLQQLRCKYKFIKRAPLKEAKRYQDLGRQLASARKSFKDEITREFKKDYRFRFHNEEMKRQLDKTIVADVYVEPVVEHQLEERTHLQRILCDFSIDLSMKDIVDRKICAISLMIALASRQETQKPRSSRAYEAPVIREAPRPEPSPRPVDEFPLICGKTQCIMCIGNERYSYEKRNRCFERPSHMMDHVENVHLKYQAADEKVACHHPVCKSKGLVLNDISLFKNHVARVHGITLREPRYLG